MDTLTTVIAVTDGDQENSSLCPSLGWKYRLGGFVCCFAGGLFFSILSCFSVFLGNYRTFGVFFTLANLLCIAGSFFLAGPLSQAKSAFSEDRWMGTVAYLITLVLTLLAALWLKSGILVIIFSIVQFGALLWYFLSYIPGANNCLKSVIAAKFS